MQERRNELVRIINERGAVSFSQLKDLFPNVSEMTIRNDLKALDEKRLIVRVHGGAKSVDRIIGTDDIMDKRMVRNADKKREIAAKAVRMMLPGTTIYLDSGSTALELAKIFPDQSQLVVTSGLLGTLELSRRPSVKVFLLGGSLNSGSLSVSGASSCDKLRTMNFDVACIGVTGYMEDTGFTCGSDEESELKRVAISRADTKILLMDSSKVGISNPFTFATLDDIDVLVSDGGLDAALVAACAAHHVRIL